MTFLFQVYIQLQLNQVQARHRSLSVNGVWENTKVVNYTLTSQPYVTLAVEMTPLIAGTRQATIKILDGNQMFQPVTDFDIPTIESLEDNAYYMAFVHSKFNASFITSGNLFKKRSVSNSFLESG